MRHGVDLRVERSFVAPRPPASTFYTDDLLPELQRTLAALADLEVSFEIARDDLEDWSGAEEDKQRCRAELDAAHRKARDAQLKRLAFLQNQIRASALAA
jgi:hypothetical protein